LHGGWLDVVAAGPLPPDPGEFVGSKALGSILDALADHADLVIIDSPPLLSVGDTMTLSAHVDALLLVCRANVVRRPMLAELQRLLRSTPATAIGFVLTDAGEEDQYSYPYGYGSGYAQSGQSAVPTR
jgi:Mrp family chromosome partitioning ATPase